MHDRKIFVAGILAILVVLALLSGCAGKGVRVETVEVVKYVDRQVPIAAPCKEAVTRPTDPLRQALGMEPESRVEVLLQSSRLLRTYIAGLEAAALGCGVTINAN